MRTRSRWLALSLLAVVGLARVAVASAPQVIHTPGYESPVHGGPDDLLLIAGSGFEDTDRVVYQEAGPLAGPAKHPDALPRLNTARLGTAPLVQVGDPPYSLTIQLPEMMQPGRPYRLWVVNASNEWSAPIMINDQRPLWITPAVVNESADATHTGRRIRVVGRNLQPWGGPLEIRLQGPRTYVIATAQPG